MSIAGTWKGEYTFDESKGAEAAAGHVVPFTLELKPGWLGAVAGSMLDDPRAGFKEPGTIKGTFKKGVLRFRKLQPTLRMFHERNWMTLEETAERHKFVVDEDKGHPPIFFAGELSEDGNSIKGSWKMEGFDLDIPGSYRKIQLPTVGGAWHATRQR